MHAADVPQCAATEVKPRAARNWKEEVAERPANAPAKRGEPPPLVPFSRQDQPQQLTMDLGRRFEWKRFEMEFISRFTALPDSARVSILAAVMTGDYTTPTCPRGDVKLIARVNDTDLTSFWGCPKYPKCRYTLDTRAAPET